METNLSHRRGIFEFSTAMLLSGTLGLFVFESGQSAWTVVFFRCLFGALSLVIYCWGSGLLDRPRFTRRTLVLTLLGGVAIVANWVLLFNAYHFASISVATAVYHTQPFFLVLLGAGLLGDRPTAGTLGWIGVAFVGLLFVIKLDPATLNLSSETLVGFALALGAAVLYAVATLIAKQLKGVPPHLIALVQVSLGTVVLAPFADFGAALTWGSHWFYLVGLGVIHTCLMYILLYSGIQKLAVGPIAVLSFIYPIVAIGVDYAFYGQNLTITQFAGVGLILVGSAGVNLKWTLPARHSADMPSAVSAARIESDLS